MHGVSVGLVVHVFVDSGLGSVCVLDQYTFTEREHVGK